MVKTGSLNILLCPFGSEGDVNPMLWMAEGFRRLGHYPHFVLTSNYGRLAAQAGFPWTPVGGETDFEQIARDPRFWSPLTGPAHVSRAMLDSLGPFQEAVKQSPGPDIVIGSTFAVAAFCFAEAGSIPRVTMHMQPAVLRSVADCPVFGHGMGWLRGMPAGFRRLSFHVMDLFLNSTLRAPLNRFREKQGLPALADVYRWLVGEQVILPVPAWFAPPQPEWPEELIQCGFPNNPHIGEPVDPRAIGLKASGRKVVLWTHGSANYDTARFWKIARAVTADLGIASLFVGPSPPDGPLPADSLHLSHAPFESLMPFCDVMVHHGGIGTTAKAIASGVPQLVIPRAHDQPDNAARVSRLGVGLSLPYPLLSETRVRSRLRKVLEERSYRRRAAELAPLAMDSKPEEAAGWMVQLVFNKASSKISAGCSARRPVAS
ncbi:MAG: glycosyltransferase [Terrimicrobiaceae bacterium]